MTVILESSEDHTLDLTRASYKAISLYAPNRAPADIDLSDNTNLWGVAPAVLRAISDTVLSTVTRYPSLYADAVKQAIAVYLGATPDMIVTGCGSDDVLDSIIRAFGEPGDVIAYPDPSFAMIPIFAKMNGLTGLSIPLTNSNDADADRYISADARINYLCTPNNPTGTSFSPGTIERIIKNTTGIVIIDEAYAEFATQNCLNFLRLSPRVVITRTLSKAFGLAGFRIGYAIGAPSMIAEIEKSRGPYKVSGVAQHVAVAALTDGRAWVEEHIRLTVANRDRLAISLTSIGFKPLASDANFLLVPVPDATEWDRRLRATGIAVRPFADLPRIGDALRVSVGPWSMMEKCIAELREIRG